MIQNPEAVLKDLKSKKYAPIYFLHGDESYYIDAISNFIEENVLQASEKSFNQILLYGKDSNMQTMMQQARRFPMMAERQVIVVKELQQMQDWNKETANKLFNLYLDNPQKTTILVLNYKHKTFNKNTKLYKAIEKKAVVVESKKLNDHKILDWIGKYLKSQEIQVEAQTPLLLLETIGSDMGRLKSEIDKVIVNSPEKKLTTESIEKYIGISKDYNIFEFQKALAVKDWFRIQKMLKYWEANPKAQALIPTLAMIFQFFTKLLLGHHSKDKSDRGLAQAMGIPPFALKDYRPAMKNFNILQIKNAIHAVRKADMQAKGIHTQINNDAEILKELVCVLMAI